MKARDLVYETASALDANRGRSLLTVLGIVIGIAAVIAMTALIGGVKQAMISDLGLGQAQLVNIWCSGNREMTVDDVAALELEMARDYEYAMPVIYGGAEVTSGSAKVENGQMTGVEPEYADMMRLTLVQGRFFTQQEADSGALVVVMDQAGVKALFGSAEADAVGKTVKANRAEFTVVGVVESTSMQAGSDWAQFYLPYKTCCKRISGYTGIDSVFGLAREGSDMEAVAARTEEWLALRFKIADEDREDSIWVQTMDSVIRELDSAMMSFQLLMTSVASISLVVGGIGIMNMMLTNVTERIREIGLRKALGARRRDITRQFLLESVCLTLAGGIIGIVAGYAGAYALSGLAGSFFAGDGATMQVTPYLDFGSMLMVAGICVAIGIAFGYYPARRAARLDPVESLRYQ